MPKRVSVDEVVKTAVEAEAKKKKKLEAHRVANNKYYTNLSDEKKAAQSKRNSEGNKQRMKKRTDAEKEEFRAKDRQRKQKARDAKKEGTKLEPGSQSVAPKKSIVYPHKDEKPTPGGGSDFGRADLILWSQKNELWKRYARRSGVWSCKHNCGAVYWLQNTCIQHERLYCAKRNDSSIGDDRK